MDSDIAQLLCNGRCQGDNNHVGHRDPSATSCTTVNLDYIVRSIYSPVEKLNFFPSISFPLFTPTALFISLSLCISSMYKQPFRSISTTLNYFALCFSVPYFHSLSFFPFSSARYQLSLFVFFTRRLRNPAATVHTQLKRHLVSQIATSIRLAKLDLPHFFLPSFSRFSVSSLSLPILQTSRTSNNSAYIRYVFDGSSLNSR